MTDRTVTVRLRANAEQYDRAMTTATMKTRGLERSVMTAQASAMRGFNQMGTSAGRGSARLIASLTGVSLGFLGVAKGLQVSVKHAQDFQQKMELVATQAGASQREVNRLTKAVLLMAPAVGVGPADLADGLYHVESAGFRGAQALSILNAAAKASRIGMSGMEETTQALIGTMAVGLPDVHSASDAIAFLNKIVGVGDMRMSKLAASISTGVLPSFKSAGLGMIDYGAALATLTDNVTPADEAATRLRMTISLMAAPSAKAQDALKTIGLSGSSLAKDLRKPDGLLVAVMDLKKHLHDSGQTAVQQNQTLEHAFGGGRTSGAILTLIEESDRLTQKYRDIGGAATRARQLQEAWAQTQKTSAQNTAELRSAVETLSIRFGSMLLPEVTDVTKYLSGHTVPAISKFIDGMQKGTGPGGDFAATLQHIGHEASSAWGDVQPMFDFIGKHPDLFKEIGKDAAIFAVAMKGIGVVKKLPGLGGSAAGSAAGSLLGRGSTPANPLFVYDIGGKGKGTIAKDLEKVMGAGGVAKLFNKLGWAAVITAYTSGVVNQQKKYNQNQKAEHSLEGRANDLMGRSGGASAGVLMGLIAQADKLAKSAHVSYDPKHPGQYVVDPKTPADVRKGGMAAANVAMALRQQLSAVNRDAAAAGDDPKVARAQALHRAAALTAAKADAKQIENLLTGGVLVPLDKAKVKADALSVALDEMFRTRQLQIDMATGQTSLHVAERQLGIGTVHPAPVAHRHTTAPAPASTPATRGQSQRTGGLTIHGGVTIQQLPGESSSGSFVRGLEHAAFLAGAG